MSQGNKCAHGYARALVPAVGLEPGWVVPVSPDCPLCDGAIGAPFMPGNPPGPPRRRTIEEVQADIQERAPEEAEVAPLPDPEDVCVVCKGEFGPQTVTVPVEGGGRRHVDHSPDCARPVFRTPPEPASAPAPQAPQRCSTCGQIEYDDPKDLLAIRATLTAALEAVDAIIQGEKNAQEALEQIDPGT